MATKMQKPPVVRGVVIDDDEIELWVMNTEWLYRKWEKSGLTIEQYINKHRNWLISSIRQAIS